MQKKSSDPDDAPQLTGEELNRADVKWRIGGKEVSAAEGKAAFREILHGKTRTNIHFDNDVIAHYKAKAGPRGYQTLINAALRRDMERSELKGEVLQSMKEEFLAMKVELLDTVGKLLNSTPKASGAAVIAANISGPFGVSFTATHELLGRVVDWGAQQAQEVTTGNSNSQIILATIHPQGNA
jgi:uncharacterized protein (DUF4415 family)